MSYLVWGVLFISSIFSCGGFFLAKIQQIMLKDGFDGYNFFLMKSINQVTEFLNQPLWISSASVLKSQIFRWKSLERITLYKRIQL